MKWLGTCCLGSLDGAAQQSDSFSHVVPVSFGVLLHGSNVCI